MRYKERKRRARVRRTKNKESAFLSLPNDVADMADCGEEDDKEKEKKKGNALSHARRVLVRLHLIHPSLSLSLRTARQRRRRVRE